MSCLVCLASYCPLHLEPHYLDAALRRHRLVSALKNFEGPCRHHGRSVDRFCRTDRTCICTMCADTDHRDHRIVPLSKEAARAKVFTEITNDRFCAVALEFLFKFFRNRNYSVMEKHSLHICNCLIYLFPCLNLRLSL